MNEKKIYAALSFLILCLCKTNQTPVPTSTELQARYGAALEAIFGIGIRLQALLEDPTVSKGSNFLVSPLSVALTIGQLMLGAEGKFREELYNLLSLPDNSTQKFSIVYRGKDKNTSYTLPYANLHLQLGNLVRALEGNEISRSFTLNSSNALFVKSDSKLKDEFLNHLLIYQTQVQAMNFSSDPVGCQKIINDWASTQTNGLVSNILPTPLPVTASAVFTNAIYFLADWETPFSYETNIRAPFRTSKNNSVEIEYMMGHFENISYGESSKLGFKMIAFPYKNNELAMYFILPIENDGNEFNIKKFAEGMNAKEILQFMPEMKKHSVTIQMPKMKLSTSISILEPLQRYHLYKQKTMKSAKSTNKTGDALDILKERVDDFTAFNTTEEAEILLTQVAEGESLRVNNLLQQMTLSIDEKGTEAAAVTATIIDYIGGSKNFKLDRPFVFFIRHEPTSATLFWGTIVDPSQSQ